MNAPMLGMQSQNWHAKATHSRGYIDNDNRQFERWCLLWATECHRVLKPGGHLIAFGGTRTWHRLTSAVEDAGFEIRDSLAWLFASGFPKSLDVAKAIGRASNDSQDADVHAEAVALASHWEGWGTALKPGHEPIVLARKPLIGTVATNVAKFGTGGLNIGGCRIDDGSIGSTGRWPSNALLDGDQAAVLDAVADNRASRFFFVAKPDQAERVRVNEIAHPTVKPLALMRYLVRLVTPPEGTVLEPFAGSGTTVEACVLEGFKVIAIEKDPAFVPLILQRIDRRLNPVRAVQQAGGDTGLFALIDDEVAT